MAVMVNDNKTKIRYNLQNWLKDGIEEFNYKRIGSALNIKTGEVKKQIRSYIASVENQAEKLDNEKKYSSKISCSKNKKILFIGDSNTSDRESYMRIVRAVYKSTGHEFIDSAVSGWRTTEFIDDISFFILCYDFDIVHIMLGTNEVRRIDVSNSKSINSAEEYDENIKFLLGVFNNMAAKTIISTLPPYNLERETFKSRKWDIEKSNFDRFNEIIERNATRYNCVLNDMRQVYSKCEVDDILEEDGIHLNKKGQFVLAEQVVEKLTDIINA